MTEISVNTDEILQNMRDTIKLQEDIIKTQDNMMKKSTRNCINNTKMLNSMVTTLFNTNSKLKIVKDQNMMKGRIFIKTFFVFVLILICSIIIYHSLNITTKTEDTLKCPRNKSLYVANKILFYTTVSLLILSLVFLFSSLQHVFLFNLLIYLLLAVVIITYIIILYIINTEDCIKTQVDSLTISSIQAFFVVAIFTVVCITLTITRMNF
jgi:hypothetical protein